MKPILLALLIVTFAAPAAGAADITVYSPGIANAGLRRLADAWTVQTGNRVTITGGNVGRILTSVNVGEPGDLVLLPPDNLKDISAKLKPDAVPVGRALFGIAVKAGGARGDISTLPKFAAFLKQAGALGFPDPATGSLSGAMILELLKRPEFAGVAGKPLKENAAAIVVNGDAPYSAGVIGEEIPDPAAELVAPFPEALDMHIDLSGAVLTTAAAPAEAASFLRYITTAQAASVWHDCGIDANRQIVTAPYAICTIAAPTIAGPPGNDEVRAPRPPRGHGIAPALAVEGALGAIETCLGKSYKVTALVTDSAGVPVAMISGDSAAAITQRIAMSKAQAVLKYKMTSGEVTAKAAADAGLAAEIGADPLIRTARQGAIPIMAGAELLGAFAVSGAPSGDQDEPCAKAGLAKIQDRIR